MATSIFDGKENLPCEFDLDRVLFAIYDTKDLEDVEIILSIRDNKFNRYESK